MAMFTGEGRYEEVAASALRLIEGVATSAPTGFGHALCALDLSLGPSHEVAVIGDPQADGTQRLLDRLVRDAWRPNCVLAVASPEDADEATVALLAGRRQLDGKPTAYVCHRFVCQLPVTTVAELDELLRP